MQAVPASCPSRLAASKCKSRRIAEASTSHQLAAAFQGVPAVKTGFWQGRTVKPMHTSVSQHVVPTMTVTFCINHDERVWHVLPVDMAPLLAVSMNNANQSILRLSAQLVPSSCLNPFILANQASWPIKLHHSSWPDSSSCNGWMSQSLVLSCLCSQDSSWHATHCADAAHQLDTCFIRYVQ